MQFSTSQETQLARPFQIVPVAVLPAIAVEGARSDDHALEVVQSQMLRLRRVVEDMFMLAQADSGIYAASKTTFYLDEVVLESIRAGRVLGNVRGVQVSVGNIAPEAEYVGDEGLLRQLLLILIDNTVKYAPAAGMVEVTLAATPRIYRICVSDSGGGISTADQPYIFDRFYRAGRQVPIQAATRCREWGRTGLSNRTVDYRASLREDLA